MKEIMLTQKGSQANKDKIEIAISLDQAIREHKTEKSITYEVHPFELNSLISMSYSYNFGAIQLAVQIFGPSESKGFKQDASKAFIDFSIKNTTSLEPLNSIRRDQEEMRADIRTIIEQIILLSEYPKQVFSFQVYVLKDQTRGLGLLPAIVNGCLTAINLSGISMKVAKAAAIGLVVRELEMSDDGGKQVEIVSSNNAIETQNSTIIDCVVCDNNQILFMKTLGAPFRLELILGEDESSSSFMQTIKEEREAFIQSILSGI